MRSTKRAVLGLLTSLLAVGGVVAPIAVPSAHAALGAGGEYLPVAPARIVDTRSTNSPLSFGTERTFQVTNATALTGAASGIPATNVLAVMATVTVTAATKDGYVTVYPKGVATPNASNINFRANRDTSNVVLLRPGTDGQVAFKFDGATNATAHVIVDVVGWFSTSSGATRGARLLSVEPVRVLDSRNGVARSGALGAGEQFKLPIRGAGTVPNEGAVTGVLMNLTVVSGASATFVSVQPEAFAGFPTTSNVNLRAGEVKANLVVVPVGADGTVSVFNERGSSHVIADVVGYFRAGIDDETRTGRIVPLASPFRVFDTRSGPFANTLGNQSVDTWDFDDDTTADTSFVDSVKLDGAPVGAISSVLMNLTLASVVCPCVPSTARDTFLYLFPDPNDPAYNPDNRSSTVNSYVGNTAVANFAVARLSTEDKLGVFNKNGYVHYLGDVAAVVLE